MTIEKKGRGPGRPAADGATGLINISVALTTKQREWVREGGGSVKLRELIDREILRELIDQDPPKEKRAKKAR